MKISIVIPCYNEAETIEAIVQAVLAAPLSNLEIIIVDDCSTDGTKAILNSLQDDNIKLIAHDTNLGKGASLRSGFAIASGDVCIVQDADLEYDPFEYPLLINPIISDNADAGANDDWIKNVSMGKKLFIERMNNFPIN